MSARSYSEIQLKEMVNGEEYAVFTLTVEDKYGKMGIVGMAVVKQDVIEAFMLSCRAFDRGFEYMLLNAIKNVSRSELCGIYSENGKNSRYANFYQENGIKTL